MLAQYWLLKEKFLGSESGSAAADAADPRGMDDDDGHTHTHIYTLDSHTYRHTKLWLSVTWINNHLKRELLKSARSFIFRALLD